MKRYLVNLPATDYDSAGKLIQKDPICVFGHLIKVEDGHLKFFDTEGNLITAFSDGNWQNFLAKEE